MNKVVYYLCPNTNFIIVEDHNDKNYQREETLTLKHKLLYIMITDKGIRLPSARVFLATLLKPLPYC